MTYTPEQFQTGEGLPERKFMHAMEIPTGMPMSELELQMSVDITGEKAMWGYFRQYGAPPTHVQTFDFACDDTGLRVIGTLACEAE